MFWCVAIDSRALGFDSMSTHLEVEMMEMRGFFQCANIKLVLSVYCLHLLNIRRLVFNIFLIFFYLQNIAPWLIKYILISYGELVVLAFPLMAVNKLLNIIFTYNTYVLPVIWSSTIPDNRTRNVQSQSASIIPFMSHRLHLVIKAKGIVKRNHTYVNGTI